MDEIRQEIDRIDKQIISLIADRYTFVKAVTQFKKTTDEIKAQERYDAVLVARGKLAAEYGLDPEMVQEMWTVMMNWFIEKEEEIIVDRDNGEKAARLEKVNQLQKQSLEKGEVVRKKQTIADNLLREAISLVEEASALMQGAGNEGSQYYQEAADKYLQGSQRYSEAGDAYGDAVKHYEEAQAICQSIIDQCDENSEASQSEKMFYLSLKTSHVGILASYQNTRERLSSYQSECLTISQMYLGVQQTCLRLLNSNT